MNDVILAAFLDELEKIGADPQAIPQTFGNDLREYKARWSAGVPMFGGQGLFQRPKYTQLTAQATRDASLGKGGFSLPTASSTSAAQAKAAPPAPVVPKVTPPTAKAGPTASSVSATAGGRITGAR